MSNSLLSSIKGLLEGAREKTADGMTKDAKHFRDDLHVVKDDGMKYLVQKDSETKDYEKMFNGDVEQAPARLGDLSRGKDLDKYVEYNEHVKIEEAKKAAKEKRGCSESCECKDCSSESKAKSVNEIYAQPGTPAGNAYNKQLKGNVGNPALPLQAGQTMKPIADKGKVAKTTNSYTPPKPAAAAAVRTPGGGARGAGGAGYSMNTGRAVPIVDKGTSRSSGDQPGMGANIARNIGLKPNVSQVKPSGMSGNYPRGVQTTTTMAQQSKATSKFAADRAKIQKPASPPPAAAAAAPKPKADSQGTSAVKIAPAAPAAKPAAPKPKPRPEGVAVAPKPKVKPAAAAPVKKVAPAAAAAPAQQQKKPSAMQRQQARNRLDKGAVGPEAKALMKTSGLGVTTPATYTQKARPQKKTPIGMKKEAFEIDGVSYSLSESHISAIEAFVKKYGVVDEMTAGDFIKREMKHPEKLTAKTRAMKVKQAFAIYKSKERRGEKP